MAMAIAEHRPSKLFHQNAGLLKMSHQQLHDFASTSHSNLPYKKYNAIPAAIRERGRKTRLTKPPGGRSLGKTAGTKLKITNNYLGASKGIS